MDKSDRLQKLHRVFKTGRRHSYLSLAEYFDCSTVSVKRYIKEMRDLFNAPTHHDRSGGEFCYLPREEKELELPGVWLTAEEVQGLATILVILNDIEHGFVGKDIALVEKQIARILQARGIDITKFQEKIQFLPMRKHTLPGKSYSVLAQALLQEKRILITYEDYSGHRSQRSVSPLKVVFYQDNWYLQAYCHKREALRSFMISKMMQATILGDPIASVSKGDQLAHYRQSYGIFAGQVSHEAKLRFLPRVAREVANQSWHESQQGEWQGASYLLTLPYSDDRELLRDILSYGKDVQVLAPDSLKNRIHEESSRMCKLYEETLTE
ncbi:MAG: hypothetical protein COA42_22870 [Alteromonadaceae bacterium]|nr:MAG: hypothetical protein COA42_22870 [Alteromonadaceae bacterium]